MSKNWQRVTKRERERAVELKRTQKRERKRAAAAERAAEKDGAAAPESDDEQPGDQELRGESNVFEAAREQVGDTR